jgi:hypothetical protein
MCAFRILVDTGSKCIFSMKELTLLDIRLH